jgi:hypothetical protein
VVCEDNFAAAAREDENRFQIDALERLFSIGFFEEKINARRTIP